MAMAWCSHAAGIYLVLTYVTGPVAADMRDIESALDKVVGVQPRALTASQPLKIRKPRSGSANSFIGIAPMCPDEAKNIQSLLSILPLTSCITSHVRKEIIHWLSRKNYSPLGVSFKMCAEKKQMFPSKNAMILHHLHCTEIWVCGKTIENHHLCKTIIFGKLSIMSFHEF